MEDLIEVSKVNRYIHAVTRHERSFSRKRLNNYKVIDLDIEFYSHLYVPLELIHEAEDIIENEEGVDGADDKCIIVFSYSEHRPVRKQKSSLEFHLVDPNAPDQNVTTEGINITDEEFFKVGIEVNRIFTTEADAFRNLDGFLTYFLLDQAIINSISLDFFIEKEWIHLKDFNAWNLLRCKVNMRPAYYPANLHDFFSSRLFYNGIESIDFCTYKMNRTHFEFCNPATMELNQLYLPIGVGLSKEFLEQTKCKQLRVYTSKILDDWLEILMKRLYEESFDTIEYEISLEKSVDLRKAMNYLPESVTSYEKRGEMEKIILKSRQNGNFQIIKSVRTVGYREIYHFKIANEQGWVECPEDWPLNTTV
ncbi:hypothetical protein WR25_06556 [Diploscapter pachys]|uniref:Uncharacterized protein n=1 Tax=Diploscapter pachys TaxID=2018661 RepID=A0A2A2JDT8_9BILA|nr:hypothetical protein WR25_06556 [Diploscapter pachys]